MFMACKEGFMLSKTAVFLAVAALLFSLVGLPVRAADNAMKVVVSVPGPRNISYLPIELISRLGADRAEGIRVELLQVGGGAVALQELMNRNSDFAVAGFPAAMSLRANGGDVVGVAAVNDLPLFILMVRTGLREQVKRVADLRGRVIGVNTSSLSSKTTSQQLAELVLESAGVKPEEVRIVAAGQSWLEQSSLLTSGAADAVMGDEPFASRLLAEKKVFFLVNLSNPANARHIPGAGFLHAALETRAETVRNSPEKVAKMVRALRRTLQWMASRPPEEIIEKLGVPDEEEKASLLASLRAYPRLYSPDGRFSTRQLRETQHFFRATSGRDPAARALEIESIIIDRWSGRKE
jgi:NitT/TauT family transport system substrate-binding protein